MRLGSIGQLRSSRFPMKGSSLLSALAPAGSGARGSSADASSGQMARAMQADHALRTMTVTSAHDRTECRGGFNRFQVKLSLRTITRFSSAELSIADDQRTSFRPG